MDMLTTDRLTVEQTLELAHMWLPQGTLGSGKWPPLPLSLFVGALTCPRSGVRLGHEPLRVARVARTPQDGESEPKFPRRQPRAALAG